MFKKSISVLIFFFSYSDLLQIFFHENLEYQKCKITSSDSYSATPFIKRPGLSQVLRAPVHENKETSKVSIKQPGLLQVSNPES